MSAKKFWLVAYRIIVVGMIIFGSLTKVAIVWDLDELFMSFMAIVNLIAILLLGKFAFKALKIQSIRSLTDGKHLKLSLKSNNNTFVNAIGFNLGHLASEFTIGDKVDVAGNLEINSFNGVDSIQINLKDVMKSI